RLLFSPDSVSRNGYAGNGVLVTQRINAQHVASDHPKRLQNEVQQVGRNVVHTMFELPRVPEAINHAVVRPEDGIPGRSSNTSHTAGARHIVTAGPAMNEVVKTFKLVGKVVEM